MNTILQQSFTISSDHFIGPPDAGLEIIQYGDFQCEHCGGTYTTMKLLQECFGRKLRFVFRHFPLPAFHPLALDAAVACEAAALQNKFWEMYDLIFENQLYLVRCSFSRFEDALALRASAFIDPATYKNLVNKVAKDFEAGLKAGVDGTPTFFINGRRHTGFDDFVSLYEACLLALNSTTVQPEFDKICLSKMSFLNV